MSKTTKDLVPDFDDMEQIIKDLAVVESKRIALDSSYKSKQAECIRDALTNQDYWIGSKQPSMAYCNSVVAYVGNTDDDMLELNNMINELAMLSERSNLLKQTLQLYRDKLDLYRTQSANERGAHF